MTSYPTGPARTVLSILDRRGDGDIDGACAYFDPDIACRNVSSPIIRRIGPIAWALGVLDRPHTGFEVVVHYIATDGDTVLTERTEVIRWRSLRIEFWVCGTSQVHGGRITLWRDHFDNAAPTLAVLRGAIRAVDPRRLLTPAVKRVDQCPHALRSSQPPAAPQHQRVAGEPHRLCPLAPPRRGAATCRGCGGFSTKARCFPAAIANRLPRGSWTRRRLQLSISTDSKGER